MASGRMAEVQGSKDLEGRGLRNSESRELSELSTWSFQEQKMAKDGKCVWVASKAKKVGFFNWKRDAPGVAVTKRKTATPTPGSMLCREIKVVRKGGAQGEGWRMSRGPCRALTVPSTHMVNTSRPGTEPEIAGLEQTLGF